MVLSNITLTTSDVIDLIGIFASLFIGVIAIIISILSLCQNSKMIEESTRPNIQIYPVFLDDFFYIIIRNFGNSEAVIDEIKCSHKFNSDEYFGDPQNDDFAKLNGSSFCPGYSVRCPLASYAVENENYVFKIKYHSTTHKYNATFSFNPCNIAPFADSYPPTHTAKADIHDISKSLRNIVKLKL